MDYLPKLFRTESATWRSPYDPEATLSYIGRSFSRWRFYVRTAGSTLQIVPRGRGIPVYAIDMTANAVDAGSEVNSVVTPNTMTVARNLVMFFIIGVVGVCLELAN